MQQPDLVIDYQGLEYLGFATPRRTHWNLPSTTLVQLALARGEGTRVADGALCTTTGPHTGRSPNDRFIVDERSVRGSIDWGKVNRPIEAKYALRLWTKARAHAAQRELFVQDLHVGADPQHQRRVRIITETAWHALFARNMFRECPRANSTTSYPISRCCSCRAWRPTRRTTARARRWPSCSTSAPAPC